MILKKKSCEEEIMRHKRLLRKFLSIALICRTIQLKQNPFLVFVKSVILLLFIFSLSNDVEAKAVTMRGTAIGIDGIPLSNATIFYSVESKESINDCNNNVQSFTVSSEQGNFLIEVEKIKKGDKVKIFIINKLLVDKIDGDAPILPPFSCLNNLLGNFEGIEVVIGKSSEINLGFVTSYLIYKTVEIKYPDKYDTNSDKPPFFWITVKNKRGEVVLVSSISRVAVLKDRNIIKLALPVGVWFLDFSLSKEPWQSIGKVELNMLESKTLYVISEVNSIDKGSL